MDPVFRRAYNAAFGPNTYADYLERLERRVGSKIPFRVAETPLFLPEGLRSYLAKSAKEIVQQISRPNVIETMKRAIPAHLDAPGMDPLPNCVQVDFAIVRGPSGELEGRVVELQAFPSLYALMVLQSEVMADMMRTMPGLDRKWSIFFGGLDREGFVARLRKAVLADEDPANVVLLDIDPPNQKTYPDFLATKELIGVDAVCPTTLVREGRKLFRKVAGKLVEVRRIYNRVVFDELEARKIELPFRYTDDLDITWCSHPNWYWTWSKYTLPYIDHPAVPRARYLSELSEIPNDLERYVLKPLFSFAGSGVKVDPTKEDIAAIPASDRHGWLLQEKISYEPALPMPDGSGVKGEVRMMFLRAPDEPAPELVLNLVRLSRGKMLGVDQNKDLTWVGGTVGLWPVD
ncbi:hypothetical protein [Polyangium jinanense]|uniref:Circularly permuted type 2 ATP-grasp protein n=1 Tax=Polyangium jinanense TaxID=2829994 RepID=A0A9X4AX27_9BACT|nr:hypothetical protein [Polyangium jinanense]MDC3958430.1 hypothetical protein [Polyangium jinanense]MDC3987983.1 hypothetical protein [Polyangium jinanense]